MGLSGTRDLRRREILTGATVAAAAASIPKAAFAGAQRRPNILFILADDLGFADLSCYGRRDYRTPVIDRLAADGLLLTQAYANSAVCSPTRVSLITGRYHQRLQVGLPEPIRSRKLDNVGLPPQHPTLPSLLRADGYRTGLVGKWHMGWPPQHGPLRFGYDHFFGVVPGAVDYISHKFHSRDVPATTELYEGEQPIERSGYLTDLLAERAIAFLRESEVRPFLLSLHFTAPHWPWQGRGDGIIPETPPASEVHSTLRHVDGGSLEKYAEMVGLMDAAIGRVLAALDEIGRAGDTIVIFTSDNGGERFSDTWPLRGSKGELLEGGIRVPAIVRWPGRIREGSRSNQVSMTMDWLPTLVAAAGSRPDPRLPPDGENLLDVFTGISGPRRRKLFWRFQQKGQAAVRDGDWKYLKMDGEEQLFDLAKDPRERVNLRHAHAEAFERLKRDYVQWDKTMLRYPPPPVPPAGKAA